MSARGDILIGEACSDTLYALSMRTIKRVIGETNKAVLALGSLAGALLGIYGVVQLVVPEHKSGGDPTPAVLAPEAKFEKTGIEPNVPLEEYVFMHESGGLGSAFVQPAGRPSRARPIPETESPSSKRPAIELAVYVSSAATAAEPVDTTTPPTAPAIAASANGENEGEGKSEGEESGTTTGSTGAFGATGENGSTGGAGSTGATGSTGDKQAREEARKRREAVEPKRNGALEAKRRAKTESEEGKLTSDQGHGKTRQRPGYTHFAVPPPPAMAPHEEGDARVLVGTGAAASKVEAVLRKVEAILAAEGVAYSASATDFDRRTQGTASASGETAFHRITSAAEISAPGNTGPNAQAGPPVRLHTFCGTSCGLLPLIDHEIDDSYSNLGEAAQKIASIFTETRFTKLEGALQPVGVTVAYKLDLRDYIDKKIFIVWTLYNAHRRALTKTWWRYVIVKRVEPRLEDMPIIGNFWAPVPRREGNYHFTLRVFNGKHEEESATTGTFH